MSTSSPTTTTAAEVLRARGVTATVADQLAQSIGGALIVAWCDYAARQRHMGPGALIDGVRSGSMPPAMPRRLSDQAEYGRRIEEWLRVKLPDVCRADPRVVRGVRRLYGDSFADGLESVAAPHFAAVAAVIRLHYEHGKGSLTVREHGPVIRAAVRAANDALVSGFEAIAAVVVREER